MEHDCEEYIELNGAYDFDIDNVVFYGHCRQCRKRIVKPFEEKPVIVLNEELELH